MKAPRKAFLFLSFFLTLAADVGGLGSFASRSALAAATATQENTVELAALAEGNVLLRFRSDQPAEAVQLAIQGVNEALLGIDWRPADGKVYGLSELGEIFVLDCRSGKATHASQLTRPYPGDQRSGFDFTPAADRLRLVSRSGQNFRTHVGIGATAVDRPLVFVANDINHSERPRTAAVAYSNNVAQAPTTEMFNIDADLDVLVLQDPNRGTLETIGALGVDIADEAGFEIVTLAGGQELAFAASRGQLYRIDLASGRAAVVGPIGDGTSVVHGLSFVPSKQQAVAP